MASEIQVYGADWCGVTHRLREYLTKARLSYDYFDVDLDDETHQVVLTATNGRRRFPLVVVEQQIVLDPTIALLQRVLSEYGIRPVFNIHAYPSTLG